MHRLLETSGLACVHFLRSALTLQFYVQKL